MTAQERKKLTTVFDEQTAEELTNGVNTNKPKAYGLGLGAIYNSNLNEVIYAHDGRTFGYYSLVRYFSSIGASYTVTFNSWFSKHDVFLNQFKELDEKVWQYCKK